MPFGIERQWHQIYENGISKKLPPCILTADDIDLSRISFEYEDILGE